jgi:ABC-2 type transport system ATP-binding protein
MNIKIDKVTKSFGKKKAVDSISMNVGSGEIVCLLGPSGAGKTTLIRLITGAVRADSGEIMIDKVKVPDRRLMGKIGYMPQNDALYGDLTAAGNLAFFGSLYGLKGNALKSRIDEVLTLMNLSDSRNKLVSEFSGGMKKGLSLSVAMLHKPEFLLLDEPTVGIDPILRKTIWEQFHSLRKNGVAIIVATHVMDEAEKCGRAALIYEGKLIFDDKTESLKAKTPDGSIEQLFFMASKAIASNTIASDTNSKGGGNSIK